MAGTKPNTNKKTATKEAGKQNVTIGRTPEYSIFYADGARMSVSAYDMKLTFTVTETMFNNDARITEVATVVLSPQHAKDLAEALTRNVADYEKNVMSLEMKEYPPNQK
jgi:Protein of unknown function (DUF3467)